MKPSLNVLPSLPFPMKIPVSLLAALGLASLSSAATFRMWDPTPYRSQLDSPFYEGIHRNTIFVEDFEDGNLNTPFVRDPLQPPRMGATYRSLAPTIPANVVASVDADDGVLDFQGSGGDSWITFQQPPISSSHDALDHLTQKANS